LTTCASTQSRRLRLSLGSIAVKGLHAVPRTRSMDSMIDKSYNLGLVILSVAVAIVGSYVAIEIAQRVRLDTGRRRHLWIWGGALVMGLAIWTMHFVG